MKPTEAGAGRCRTCGSPKRAIKLCPLCFLNANHARQLHEDHPECDDLWHAGHTQTEASAAPRCICPTVMDGPNYSLELVDSCPVHGKAAPLPDAEPGSARELLAKWRDGSISQQKAHRQIVCAESVTDACLLFGEAYAEHHAASQSWRVRAPRTALDGKVGEEMISVEEASRRLFSQRDLIVERDRRVRELERWREDAIGELVKSGHRVSDAQFRAEEARSEMSHALSVLKSMGANAHRVKSAAHVLESALRRAEEKKGDSDAKL